MRKLLLFVLLFAGCVEPTIPKQSKSLPPFPIDNNLNQTDRLLQLHNQQRELKGRTKLNLDPRLNQFAQQWANHMANQKRLYHSNLDFMKDGKYFTGGENVAWNQKSPEEVTNAWMHSSGHRDNILNRKFTHVGFGVAYVNGQPYWCTVFAG
jgi:uncharacterized protein YkwD